MTFNDKTSPLDLPKVKKEIEWPNLLVALGFLVAVAGCVLVGVHFGPIAGVATLLLSLSAGLMSMAVILSVASSREKPRVRP